MSLPSTSGRLSTSIKIRTIKYDENGSEIPGEILGAVRKLTKNENRETTKLRSLGTHAFRPAVIVPGPITTSVNLNRVVLYGGDALEAIFGDNIESLYYQTKPFVIEVRKGSPTGRVDVVKLYDCWFTKNPMEFSLESNDLLVVQSIDVDVGRIEPAVGLQQLPSALAGQAAVFGLGLLGLKL